MKNEQGYLDALKHILFEGHYIPNDRTGVGTYTWSEGIQIKYDLRDQKYPLFTTKRVFWSSVVAELIWFLRGSTSLKELQDMNCGIWNEWQKDDSDDLGPIYGYQWRSWMGELDNNTKENDQIRNVITDLIHNPFSRRHVVTAWNPLHISDAALPPCHILFQFNVTTNDKGEPNELNCHLYQRSADMFLGVPFNVASYSLLTILIAKQVGLKPGVFTHSIGNAHIYSNHVEQVVIQLRRKIKPNQPFIYLEDTAHLNDMTWRSDKTSIELSDFGLQLNIGGAIKNMDKNSDNFKPRILVSNYYPYSYIPAEVAV